MNKPQVTLQLVTRDDDTPLKNLLELYLHDMSETLPIRISDEGRFGYAWLPTYWAEPDRRFPYLIRSEESLLGFVLVRIGSEASPKPEILEVAEFFVLRHFRRSGVGTAAMKLVWDQRPGEWLVRVSEGNPGGHAFWRKTIDEYSGGQFQEQRTTGRHYPWRVFEFVSGGGSKP